MAGSRAGVLPDAVLHHVGPVVGTTVFANAAGAPPVIHWDSVGDSRGDAP